MSDYPVILSSENFSQKLDTDISLVINKKYRSRLYEIKQRIGE